MYDDEMILLNRIRNYIISNDSKAIKDVVYDLNTLLMKYNIFPQLIMDDIIDIIMTSDLFDANNPLYILDIFRQNIIYIESSQKVRIAEVLTSIYPKLCDSATCILTLELIIDLLNELSLEVLCCLTKRGNDISRALVPYGFEYLIKKNPNITLRQKAFKELTSLLNDKNVQVRIEAQHALIKCHKYT